MRREFTFFKANLQGRITIYDKIVFLEGESFFKLVYYAMFNGLVKVKTQTISDYYLIPNNHEFQFSSEGYPDLDQALVCLKRKIDTYHSQTRESVKSNKC